MELTINIPKDEELFTRDEFGIYLAKIDTNIIFSSLLKDSSTRKIKNRGQTNNTHWHLFIYLFFIALFLFNKSIKV